MLKLIRHEHCAEYDRQPPSGGCVLKQKFTCLHQVGNVQPPSGGCVLKRQCSAAPVHREASAAFRRLCVETSNGG